MQHASHPLVLRVEPEHDAQDMQDVGLASFLLLPAMRLDGEGYRVFECWHSFSPALVSASILRGGSRVHQAAGLQLEARQRARLGALDDEAQSLVRVGEVRAKLLLDLLP